MIELITAIAFGVLCTEASTELVVHSEFFRPLRERIRSYSEFFGTLINCGYCSSVWAGALFAFLLAPLSIPSPNYFVNLLGWTLTFHRLSNFLNDFVDKYLAEKHDIDFAAADKLFGVNSKDP